MKLFSSKKRILGKVMLLMLLILLLGTGIYAWIYGDVAPKVTGSMQIGNVSGLIFRIGDAESQLIDLNANLGLSTTNMRLNEVSTANGVNFFKRDMSRYYQESGAPDNNNDEIITFSADGAKKNEMVPDGQGGLTLSGDYVDVEMKLSLDYADEGAQYYIYFLEGTLNSTTGYKCGFAQGPDSTITENGLKALRAYIKIEGADSYGPALDNTDHSAFFGNAAETEAEQKTKAVQAVQTVKLRPDIASTPTDSVLVAGDYYVDYLYPDCHSFGTVQNGTTVYGFSEYSINGADGLSGNTMPANPNYLVVLNEDCKSVNVTLRLWLEGGSQYCENTNISANDNVKFDMYLVAYKVTSDGT